MSGTDKRWRKQTIQQTSLKKGRNNLIFRGLIFQAVLEALFLSKCAVILHTPAELITMQGSYLVNKIIRVQEKWLVFVSRLLTLMFSRRKFPHKGALLVKRPWRALLFLNKNGLNRSTPEFCVHGFLIKLGLFDFSFLRL